MLRRERLADCDDGANSKLEFSLSNLAVCLGLSSSFLKTGVLSLPSSSSLRMRSAWETVLGSELSDRLTPAFTEDVVLMNLAFFY